jgi:hypothetical protein
MKTKKQIYKVAEPQLLVTHADPKYFAGLVNPVVAEVSDTLEGHAFRLRSGQRVGHWQPRYESFATLTINKRKFVLGSAYWDGTFPIEVPFEITEGKNTPKNK